MTVISLSELPEELLRGILSFLPAQSLAAVEATSRRFRTLANDPLLWRQRCQAAFIYWEQESSPFHKATSMSLIVRYLHTNTSDRDSKDSCNYRRIMTASGRECSSIVSSKTVSYKIVLTVAYLNNKADLRKCKKSSTVATMLKQC